VRALDAPPAHVEPVHVFTLQKADALAMASILERLQLGVISPQVGAPTKTQANQPPETETTPLFDVYFTVDDNTNSIVASGNAKDLAIIADLIAKLEDTNLPSLKTEIFQLQYANAEEVAKCVEEYCNHPVPVYTTPGQWGQCEFHPCIFVVAEPMSNKIAVAVAPMCADEIRQLIKMVDIPAHESRALRIFTLRKADALAVYNIFWELANGPPPAEIAVRATKLRATPSDQVFSQSAFGVRLILDDPSNSIIASGSPKDLAKIEQLIVKLDDRNGSMRLTKAIQLHHANAENVVKLLEEYSKLPVLQHPCPRYGLYEITRDTIAVAEPVGNKIIFNALAPYLDVVIELIADLDAPPKQIQLDLIIAEVDVTDTPDLGGVLFSMPIADLDGLVRDLEKQGRLKSLSRPRLTTADNQAARLLVGQSVPYNVNGPNGIEVKYRDIGVELQATPKVGPDGTVTVRLMTQLSSVAQTDIPIADGVFTTDFNTQSLETTVILKDGVPATLGGMKEIIEDKDGKRVTEMRIIITAHVSEGPMQQPENEQSEDASGPCCEDGEGQGRGDERQVLIEGDPPRIRTVIQLRHAKAEDVPITLETWRKNQEGVSPEWKYAHPNPNMVFVPDPVTNKLTVTVDTWFYYDLLEIIAFLDAPPKQIRIETIIAEVDVTDIEGGLITLGFGHRCPISGSDGFAFLTADNDHLRKLITDLEKQDRIDILTAPRVTTADNQTARVLVGDGFPSITNSVVSTGTYVRPTRKDIGVHFQVTPKIGPDGTITLRVAPEFSYAVTPDAKIDKGTIANGFHVQTLDVTVTAHDGESAIIGGLNGTRIVETEHTIPFFGDLPLVGPAFHYVTHKQRKTELLVIVTPHVLDKNDEKQKGEIIKQFCPDSFGSGLTPPATFTPDPQPASESEFVKHGKQSSPKQQRRDRSLRPEKPILSAQAAGLGNRPALNKSALKGRFENDKVSPNRPFRANENGNDLDPGLRPGLTETAFQAENEENSGKTAKPASPEVLPPPHKAENESQGEAKQLPGWEMSLSSASRFVYDLIEATVEPKK
ncbi:MAG TPA: hypothetical protein VE988_00625, partial [Gemmataceae bacterium]|nr:hypothetical protein [Gemmataceae bacterium]